MPYSFIYDGSSFLIQVSRGMKSQFDILFEYHWERKNAQDLFKYDYKLMETKQLPGRFRFFAQLSTYRSVLKREAQTCSSVTTCFDPMQFNFNNVDKNEIIFEMRPLHWIKEESETNFINYDTLLLINISPIGYCSSLLVHCVEKGYPQVLNGDSLRVAIETLLMSYDPSLRVGMNSLGAFASVNHNHFHIYHVQENLYLQSAPVKNLVQECYETVDYPAEGFTFQLLKKENILQVVKSVMKLVEWLQKENIAHNVFITRGTAFSEAPSENEEHFNAVRIYIWARKSFFGAKCNASFNPAVCELAGHLMIKDQESFENITEDEAITILHDMCHEQFIKVKENTRKIYS